MWGKWTQTKRYEKLPTSVKTSAGTPLAIKIVQSCFNKPAKERFTTFISPKYIVSSLKLLKILLQWIISLWNNFTVSILKFNTFLSISRRARYQSFGYLPHWNMVRWQAVTCCWGVLGDTRHRTSYNRREIWLLYLHFFQHCLNIHVL